MASRKITKDDIVTAWLQAEAVSPRFQGQLAQDRRAQEVQATIDGNDAAARYDLLVKARPAIKFFPWAEVSWEEYAITSRDELGQLRTCPGLNWLAFTNGTRLLKDASRWIYAQPPNLDPLVHVRGVQQTIADGESLPPIITYLPSSSAPAPVIWEGHVRAVGYYLSPKTEYPVSIYLGHAISERFLGFDNGLNFEEVRRAFLKEGQ